MSRNIVRRTLVVLGTAVVLAVGPFATAALAHVGVSASDPTGGAASSVITFRVPSEKDAATTQVQVAFPQDTPLPFVTPQDMPGWKVTVTKAPLAKPVVNDDGDTVNTTVDRITWTATAGGVPAETYTDFSVLAEQLPMVDKVTFKVLQTYSDKSVVSWIDLPTAGGPEPDHPAPVLDLAAAPVTTGPTTTATSGVQVSQVSDVPAVSAAGPAPVASAGSSSGGSGSTVGWIGVAVAVVALVVAGLALAARRRPAAH